MVSQKLSSPFRLVTSTSLGMALALLAGCSAAGDALGPICTDYLGPSGCCLQAAGNNPTAVMACQQLVSQYTSTADPMQAEASCQAAHDAAVAAGQCAAVSGGPSPSAVCRSYLACVAQATPAQLAAALMMYGPSSDCWSPMGMATQCTNACQTALTALRTQSTTAMQPACLWCASDSDCSGGFPSCDPATHQCREGCLIGGTFIAPLTPNPNDPCQSCQPYLNSSAWSEQPEGAACGPARACHQLKCAPDFAVQKTPTTETLYGVWGTGSGDVYAVGSKGTVLHTADGGMTWSQTAGGMTYDLQAVWGSSASDVYTVGSDSHDGSMVLLHTTDGGQNWTRKMQAPGYLYGVWGSGSNDVYVVGSNGGGSGFVLHSTDGGQTFAQQALGSVMLGVWGSGSSDVYAVGTDSSGNGLRAHSTDGGMSFNPQMVGTQGLYRVWGNSKSDVYAAGYNGTNVVLLHSTDAGQTWPPTTLPYSSGSPHGLAGRGNDVFVALGILGIAYSPDGGATWLQPNTGGNRYGIWGSASGDFYAVGAAGTILHWLAPGM